MPAELRLYYHGLSQPSRSVFMFLTANKITFDAKVVDLLKGENASPEYEKINPFKNVPCIAEVTKNKGKEEIGFSMSESVAIMQYIAGLKEYKVSTRWLEGDNNHVGARIKQYLFWHDGGLRKPCLGLFIPVFMSRDFEGSFGPKKPLDEKANATAKEALKKALTTIQTYYLKEQQFIGGKEISLADVLAFNEIIQFRIVGMEGEVESSDTKIKAWIDRIEKKLESLNSAFSKARTQMETSKAAFSGGK